MTILSRSSWELCLTETTAMVLVGDKLSPEMFYETKFGEIYSALLSMYHSGKAIDLVTVRAELASRGKGWRRWAAPTSLVRLAGRVASSAHLEYHALILRQMYIRREMIAGLHTLLASAADESVDLSDAFGRSAPPCRTSGKRRCLQQLPARYGTPHAGHP